MALIRTSKANGATPQTVYKACCYNEGGSSIDNTLGFNFTKEELEDFTTITLTCTKSIAQTKYVVDGTSWSSFITGNNPLTIPSFTTSLVVAVNFGQGTHEFVEVTATLS